MRRGREERTYEPIGLSACCGALAGLPRGMVRPARPDERFLASLVDAGLPAGEVAVSVRALPQVIRPIPTWATAEGLREPRRVGIALTSFVVTHPSATFLLDPAVPADVRPAVDDLPQPLRTVVEPPVGLIGVREGLDRLGVDAADLAFALPTHLHWDHVSGLLDLPGLPLRAHAVERAWIGDGPTAPAGGVLASLRGREVTTYDLDGPPVATFTSSHDLFGDGSVVLVDLAGHTPGSVGALLRTERGPVLVAGDAAWHGIQVERLRQKASFPGNLVDHDRAETFRTLHRLHAARHRIRIVPTHDSDATVTLNG